MYDVNDDHITILFKDNTLKDISEASEVMNIALLSKKNSQILLVLSTFLNKNIYLCKNCANINVITL